MADQHDEQSGGPERDRATDDHGQQSQGQPPSAQAGQQSPSGADHEDSPPDNFASESASNQRSGGADSSGASSPGGPSSDSSAGSAGAQSGSHPEVKSDDPGAGQPTANPAEGSSIGHSPDPKIQPDSSQANSDDSGSSAAGGGDSF